MTQQINYLVPSAFKSLIHNFIAGLFCGIYVITVCLSFSALFTFSGIQSYFNEIAGFYLLGTTIIMVVNALFSSIAIPVIAPTNTASSILLLIIAQIATIIESQGTSGQMYPTLFAGFVLSTLITGMFLLLFGLFRWGNIIRYIPYPVILAFMASIGWIVVSKAIITIAPQVTHNSMLMLFAAFLVAISIAILNRYSKNPLNQIAIILFSIITFYLVLYFSGTSLASLSDKGWMIGAGTDSRFWEPSTFALFSNINWDALFSTSGLIITLAAMSMLSLLINAQNFEIDIKKEVHFNKELVVAGFSNILSSLAGGIVAYLSPTTLTVARSAGGTNKIVCLVSAGCCLLLFFLGGGFLNYIPKFVFFGVLIQIGASVLFKFIYQSYFRLSRQDYFTLLTIFVVICGFGFLYGLVAGIILSIIIFLINYSKIDSIKHVLTGSSLHSHKHRSLQMQNIIMQHAPQLLYFKLQGYIFFGTAHNIVKKIKSTIQHYKDIQIEFVILDFTLVNGIDSSAIQHLSRLKQYAEELHLTLFFIGLQKETITELYNEKIINNKTVRIASSLNDALEWREDNILADELSSTNERSFQEQFAELLPSKDAADHITKYFERIEIASGQTIIAQGSKPDGLYFIESGEVAIILEHPNTHQHTLLRTVSTGNIIGEMSLYSDKPRSALVVAKTKCVLYFLSKEALDKIDRTEPEYANYLHKLIVKVVSERLSFKNQQVKELITLA